jgi:hypothetical protein
LLKLNSGYNIGIPKENILGFKIIRKFKKDLNQGSTTITEGSRSPIKKNLPKIGLVITGGTIASKLDPKTGGVKWLTDVNEFLKFYPELTNIVDIKLIEVPFMVASESMNSSHWIKIAESVKKMVDVLAELSVSQIGGPIGIAIIASRLIERYGRDYDRPITNRYLGSLLRTRLGLKTYKSHGVYVVAIDPERLNTLRERYGAGSDVDMQN